MSRRGTYLTVVLLLVALAAVVTVGCSGGDEETSTTVKRAVTTTEKASGSAASANEVLGKPLETTDSTPVEYTEAIEQGRPVVLLFYVAGSTDDVQVLDSLSTLQPDFDQYVFLLYDYSRPAAYGDLSTLLKVNYPPELVLVDGLGVVRRIWNGFVDEGTINQDLVNLGQI
jgi:hypothetical protein